MRAVISIAREVMFQLDFIAALRCTAKLNATIILFADILMRDVTNYFCLLLLFCRYFFIACLIDYLKYVLNVEILVP